MIKIRDSIRQGGVLSTNLYGSLMDQISKEIRNNDLGIPLYENGVKKACLLWVDDVLLIALEGELQPQLDITAEVSNTYHVEFGEPKSNSMNIQNKNKKTKNKHEYEIDDIKLKQTEKYKYLGYMQNSKNNNEDQIKITKGRVEAAYQNMMTLAENSTFNKIEMETIWTIIQACILPIITYSGEAWKKTKKNYDEANKILDKILKRILKVPRTGTPREALYIETGTFDPETIIKRNRINMEARIRNGTNETMKLILEAKHKQSWIQQNKEIKEEMNIEDGEMEGNLYQIKEMNKTKMREEFKTRINKTAQHKSKMQYYYEGIQNEWTPGKTANYMRKLTRNEASIIFQARTRMLKLKDNYKNGNTNLTCRICEKEEETQKHALEECEILNNNHKSITKQDIFKDNVKELRITAKIIEQRMKNYYDSQQSYIPKKKNNQTNKQNQINTTLQI